MDINILRSIATVLIFIAFIGVCFWAFSAKRRKGFEEAAQLPFADDARVEKKSENVLEEGDTDNMGVKP